jgi:hypothetical protein
MAARLVLVPAGAPYAGEHTLQFNGFFVGDFGAILASIRGEVNADDAKRLRAMYGKGDQAKVNERVAALTVRNGDLVDAADLRPVVPVELFPLHVLLAALNVYAASPPHAQRGTVDKVAVLGELARRFFAGGKKFGAVRQEHVDAVLTTAVPVADAAVGGGGYAVKEETALALIFRMLPYEWQAAQRAGLGRFLARLPASWLTLAPRTLASVKSVLANGGTLVTTGSLHAYVEALGVLSGTRFNYADIAIRLDGSVRVKYVCYREGVGVDVGDDSGIEGASSSSSSSSGDGSGSDGADDDDEAAEGDGGGGAAAARRPLSMLRSAMDAKNKSAPPGLRVGCAATLTVQFAPMAPGVALISVRGTHPHADDGSDKRLLGLPSETDSAIANLSGKGLRELAVETVSKNAGKVIESNLAWASLVVTGAEATKAPVESLGAAAVGSVYAPPGGFRGRWGHRQRFFDA